MKTEAVSPPEIGSVTIEQPRSIKVTWNWNGGGFQEYWVEYRKHPSVIWVRTDPLTDMEQRAFTVTGLDVNASYDVRVGIKAWGWSELSEVRPDTYIPRQIAPPLVETITPVVGKYGSARVVWAWEGSGAADFWVEYRKQGTAKVKLTDKIASTGSLATILTGLDPGTSYDFRVGVRAGADTAMSGWRSAELPPVPHQGPPSELRANSDPEKPGTVLVSWVWQGEGLEAAAVEYRNAGSSGPWTQTRLRQLPTNSATISGLSTGTSYEFRVVLTAWGTQLTSDLAVCDIPVPTFAPAPPETLITPAARSLTPTDAEYDPAAGVIRFSWNPPLNQPVIIWRAEDEQLIKDAAKIAEVRANTVQYEDSNINPINRFYNYWITAQSATQALGQKHTVRIPLPKVWDISPSTKLEQVMRRVTLTDGDKDCTLNLSAGTYVPGTLPSTDGWIHFGQSARITIRATGEVTIKCPDRMIFSADGPVTLEGITMVFDGSGDHGIQVTSNGELTLKNCSVRGNRRSGITVWNGSLIGTSSRVDGFTEAAISVNDGSVANLYNCSVLNSRGYGLNIFGKATLVDCIIRSNANGFQLASGGRLKLVRCAVSDNTGLAGRRFSGSKFEVEGTTYSRNGSDDVEQVPSR